MYIYIYIHTLCVCVCVCIFFRWLFAVYGISTFIGYLMPNPFLYK